MLASMSLDWMSKLMGNLGGRPGISAVLIDSNGTVLATPPERQARSASRSTTFRCCRRWPTAR